MGAMLVEDCRNYQELGEKDHTARTVANLCSLYQGMFDLKNKQREDDGGEDGEILEYTKARWSVKLPSSEVVLPRQHPAPKAKPLTKWEKFRAEKGI